MARKVIAAERTVPRYTSYPTAPHFSPTIQASTYASWLDALPRSESLSLYLHVPFCEKICLYCGCHTKATRRSEPIEAYVDKLIREINLVGNPLGHIRFNFFNRLTVFQHDTPDQYLSQFTISHFVESLVADMCGAQAHVCFGPKAHIRSAAKVRYSITSSAVARSGAGTVSPSMRAVSALMTSSNFDACTTGKSAGFAPLRMRPT